MEIGEILNEYILRLDCTAKALADAAGVSEIQISRWRKGTRHPSQESLPRLAAGIARLSGGACAEEDVLRALRSASPERGRERSEGGSRLDQLLSVMKIRTSDAARVLNFDPSYLSRIRAGKRNPANTEPIIEGVSRYVARRCVSHTERLAAAELMGVNAETLSDCVSYAAMLAAWLRGGSVAPAIRGADVSAFLKALDSFDPNEYLRAIRIADAAPQAADTPQARCVTGLKQMMACELDFLRATARADSMEPLLIYTDMPLTELAKDPDYPKQWMQAVSDVLKKGLQIVMVHNVDRPLEEMMLGLEVHIPMYMTGRITPYYLRDSNSGPFRHLLEVSGAAALSGEAISGHHAEGRYTLCFDPADLHYYRRRASALMEKAAPLMEVYTAVRAGELEQFLKSEALQGHEPAALDMPAFRNITVRVCHDRWAVVSKERAPRIDFVIRHPKLVDAIERFAAPLVDE